jgi:hypothetical protein
MSFSHIDARRGTDARFHDMGSRSHSNNPRHLSTKSPRKFHEGIASPLTRRHVADACYFYSFPFLISLTPPVRSQQNHRPEFNVLPVLPRRYPAIRCNLTRWTSADLPFQAGQTPPLDRAFPFLPYMHKGTAANGYDIPHRNHEQGPWMAKLFVDLEISISRFPPAIENATASYPSCQKFLKGTLERAKSAGNLARCPGSG